MCISVFEIDDKLHIIIFKKHYLKTTIDKNNFLPLIAPESAKRKKDKRRRGEKKEKESRQILDDDLTEISTYNIRDVTCAGDH